MPFGRSAQRPSTDNCCKFSVEKSRGAQRRQLPGLWPPHFAIRDYLARCPSLFNGLVGQLEVITDGMYVWLVVIVFHAADQSIAPPSASHSGVA